MPDENGVYYRPQGWRDTHYVVDLNGKYLFDTYPPFIKQYREDLIPEVAYRYALNEEIVDLISILIRRIKEILSQWKKPADVIVVPEPVKPVPKEVLLNAMCKAIEKHEGYYKGSRSYRNKNSGNLRYAEQAGTIGKDKDNFAIFKTYELGFQALKNMILNGAKGKSRIYHPSDNLFDFFNKYAPSSDNNDPLRYAEVVAKHMGVNPATFRLSHLI